MMKERRLKEVCDAALRPASFRALYRWAYSRVECGVVVLGVTQSRVLSCERYCGWCRVSGDLVVVVALRCFGVEIYMIKSV